MEMTQIKQNKLKMILQFSIPSIIAMLLQTVITITDGFYTGNYVGEQALAAINLGLPVLYFYLGVGLCVGVGGSVICGRLLGAKKKQKAHEVFSQTMVTAAVVCNQFVFCVCTLSANTWHPACRWQYVWIFYTVLQDYAFHLSSHGEQHGFGNVHSC